MVRNSVPWDFVDLGISPLTASPTNNTGNLRFFLLKGRPFLTFTPEVYRRMVKVV
jgi:hypothetical protein